MRSLTLTVAAVVGATFLTGCEAGSGPTAENASGLSAAATAVHSQQVLELDETYLNPCNGETVHMTGTLVGGMNSVDDLHQVFHATISETGTGLTTGASYTSHSVYDEKFNTPRETAVNFTFDYRDGVHINSATRGLSFSLVNSAHFVLMPTGDFKLTKDLESATCRG
jgi:hypothetical protein